MKNTKYVLLASALILGAGLFITTAARAEATLSPQRTLCDNCSASGTTEESIALHRAGSASTESFDLVKAKATYPLDTCVVSGEKLEGDMGGPVDYIHKEEGKPDRLVRFCCKSCIKKFKKDPAKYLKLIDDAMLAKPVR